jgi:hypothetical protein
MDLFGGPIVTPRITPGTDFKSDTGNVLALMNDPLDLSTSASISMIKAIQFNQAPSQTREYWFSCWHHNRNNV